MRAGSLPLNAKGLTGGDGVNAHSFRSFAPDMPYYSGRNQGSSTLGSGLNMREQKEKNEWLYF